MTQATATPTTPQLFFSAYHPSELRAGQRHPLLVYGHLEGALDAISSDAGQVLGMVAADYHQPGDSADSPLPPGTGLMIVPRAEGIRFEPSEARLEWSGTSQRVELMMEASGEATDALIEGSVACYLGPLLIAEIRLPVRIVPGGSPSEPPIARQIQTAEMYRAVYPSYSSADREVAAAIAAAGEILGLDYLREVRALKAGERWSEVLLRKLEQADVFQLFWSEASSRSEFVEQEWRHALHLASQRNPELIRAVTWKRPLPPVPPALYHQRFSVIAREWISSIQPPAPGPGSAADAAERSKPQAVTLEPQSEDSAPERLTVSTFVSDDPDDRDSARLRARTHISLAGDVEVILPADVDDQAALTVHTATVREALRARLAYLEMKRDSGSDDS
ncbi:MAG: toll/interleukin-1 receptor domain-containing protein [Acidobacteriota bacterium]